MDLNNEIKPKGVLITGLTYGNRKTEVAETIIERCNDYFAPQSVTTCTQTAYGKKASFYQLTTFRKFDEMIENQELFEYIKLDERRWFGTTVKEIERASILEKSPIFILDYNGLKHFYEYYTAETLKKNFCILSLMPGMDVRYDLMKRVGNRPQSEIHTSIGYAEFTEKSFFFSDHDAVKCIDGTVDQITRSTNFVPLADAIIAYSKGETQKLVVPKNLVSR